MKSIIGFQVVITILIIAVFVGVFSIMNGFHQTGPERGLTVMKSVGISILLVGVMTLLYGLFTVGVVVDDYVPTIMGPVIMFLIIGMLNLHHTASYMFIVIMSALVLATTAAYLSAETAGKESEEIIKHSSVRLSLFFQVVVIMASVITISFVD